MNARLLVSLAWRNLFRQKRRTILTLISIVFGGFLAVMMTAMQDRSFSDFVDNAARLGAGHVTIEHPEYRDRPTLSRTITATDEVRRVAAQDPQVVRVVDRITGQAMLSTATDSYGAFFIAYDPEAETDETMEFTKGLIEGELFERSDDDGIVLGKALAHNLDAELGDKIVFTLTDRSGQYVPGMQRLLGIVTTGAASTDAALVLLPLDTLRSTIGYAPDEATQVAIFLDQGRRAIDVAERIDAKIGPEARVLVWDELQPEIKAFVAMKIGGGRLMEIIIGVLVAAGIFNTIFMSVMERARELGIMLAVGFSPRQLFALVMLESGMLALAGLVGTVLVTAWPYYYLSSTGIDMSGVYSGDGAIDIGGVGMDSILRVGIFPENAAVIALAIVAATLLAGVFPAWKAGRVDPVESINLV
jgi:ABC-type lipoprotein release transport system permease subunit